MSETPTSNRLPVLADEIRQAHAIAAREMRVALQHAIDAGEKLIEAKALLKHGAWLPWLQGLDLPERTAQLYMRLARHKDVIALERRSVADLTIRGAIDALIEPKLPEKPSELASLARCLPLAGHVKIMVREGAAGWDEIWVGQSHQHPQFFYVTYIWSPRNGEQTTMEGLRKPIRMDGVPDVVGALLSGVWKGVQSFDKPYPAWTHNLLLFGTMDQFFSSIDNLGEVAALASGAEPSADPICISAARFSGAIGPFHATVWGPEVAP